MDWRALIAGMGALFLAAFAGYGLYRAAYNLRLALHEPEPEVPIVVPREEPAPPPDCSPLERFYFPVPGFYEPSGEAIDV